VRIEFPGPGLGEREERKRSSRSFARLDLRIAADAGSPGAQMPGHRTARQQLLGLLVAGLALTEANKVRRSARCDSAEV
jgi:hypothetical protein